MSKRSQTEATLFRTDNGGEVVSAVDFPDVDESSAVPQLPYEENGGLFVQLYPDPTSEVLYDTYYLYQSNDEGETWELVDVVEGGDDE